jgi:hypothetical protein
MLHDHESIIADDDYAEVSRPSREAYEIEVAYCQLEDRAAERALALAERWSSENQVEQLKVRARANARLGRHREARAALEALGESGGFDPTHYFPEAPEFAAYAGEEWFIATAIRAWSRGPGGDLEKFVTALARSGRWQLLPLAVAVADPTREPGQWAVWLGLVRQAVLERDTNQTLLFVEGADVDVKHNVSREVESVEGRASWYDPLHRWESTPKYRTETTRSVELVPNGKRFVVRYAGLHEDLVRMGAVVAFGRYAGVSGEGAPLLQASVVVERVRQQTDPPRVQSAP